MIIGKYNGSVLLTYLGVILAVIGLGFVLNGQYAQAMICLILAGLCDLFDGTVAERFQRDDEEKAFGREIDSLADMVSFAALPAVLTLRLCGTGPLVLGCAALYVLAAIIRLAYFNLKGTESTRDGRFYHGLPVTYAALIFPLLYLPLAFLPPVVTGVVWPLAMVAVAAAFVIDLKVRKPDRAMSLRLLGLAVLMVLLYAAEVILR